MEKKKRWAVAAPKKTTVLPSSSSSSSLASSEAKEKKIGGYDFKAWDKFDVDKELDNLEESEKKEKVP